MQHNNDNSKCTCTGPICDCGAHGGVVKDGCGVRVSASMMDAANGASLADQAALDRAMATYDAALDAAGLTHDKYGRDISSLDAAAKAKAVYEFELAHAYLGDRAPKLPPAPITHDKYGRALSSLLHQAWVSRRSRTVVTAHR